MTPDRWPAQEGRYEYRCNGKLELVAERYRCRQTGDDWWIDSERRVGEVEIRVQALVSAAGLETCSVRWLAKGHAPLQLQCLWTAEGVLTERVDGDAAAERDLLKLDRQAAALFPLLRVYTGSVFEKLEPAGSGQVLVPVIDSDDRGELLRPRLSDRQLERLGDEQLDIDGRALDCALYEYRGDQYGPGSRFWVAPGGLLLRYTWLQGENAWDVRWRG